MFLIDYTKPVMNNAPDTVNSCVHRTLSQLYIAALLWLFSTVRRQSTVFSVKVTKHGMCRGLSDVWEPKPGVSLSTTVLFAHAPFRGGGGGR